MGLSFVMVSWVCVGVGVALGVIGMLDFLFEGVELSWVGAHFGFGKVWGEGGIYLVGWQLLLWLFSRLLRQRWALNAGVDRCVVLLLLCVLLLLVMMLLLMMMMKMMRKNRFLLLHRLHIFSH